MQKHKFQEFTENLETSLGVYISHYPSLTKQKLENYFTIYHIQPSTFAVFLGCMDAYPYKLICIYCNHYTTMKLKLNKNKTIKPMLQITLFNETDDIVC